MLSRLVPGRRPLVRTGRTSPDATPFTRLRSSHLIGRYVWLVPAGAKIEARMPTFAEIDEWGLEPGVPVLVVDGVPYPADRVRLVVAGDDDG